MRDELSYFYDNSIWEPETVKQARAEVAAPPIRMRWVVCNKGDLENPDIRARLVACEVNTYNTDEFYAATPPLEAKKMLFSHFASQGRAGSPMQISFVDIKKAYFNGVPRRKLFVKFPREAGQEEGTCGRLLRCVYGTRDAGQIWEETYVQALVGMGFRQGAANPCCFYNAKLDIRVVVQGDDFTAVGLPHNLNVYADLLSKAFSIKVRGRLGMQERATR